jgi:hypothetical protein
MKPRRASTAVFAEPSRAHRALAIGILSLGAVGAAAPLWAQEEEEPEVPAEGPTLEFAESGGAPTFRSEAQTVTLQDVMGSALVTAEEFRLRTEGMTGWLAGCQSMRPDLPDARILPTEIADRVGKLSLAVFNEEQVNFSFRSTTDGTEYVLTVDGSQADSVAVSTASSGALTATVTAAPMIVVRNKEESFHCPNGADFTVKIEP